MNRVLSRITDPRERATKSHEYVDSYIDQVFESDVVKSNLACGNGCSACCHTQVSINSDEANLLADLIIEDKVEIDLKKLYIQGNVENDALKWFKLPYALRGCVFLDQSGSCKIYESRPIVCRTNNVLGTKDNCDTRDGIEKPVRLLNTHKSDMVTIAAYRSAGAGGTLPYMLWQALRDRTESRTTKKTKKVVKKSKLSRVKRNISKLINP